MKSSAVLLGLALLPGCLLWSQGPSAAQLAERERPLQGRALSLSLPLFPTHEMHSLKADRGEVVLLDVWATWCEPCKEALPTYDALLKRYGEQGLRVYAVNVDEDVRQVPSFLREAHVSLPVLLDTDALVAEKTLHVRLIPTTLVVDRKGVVRHVHEGFSSPQTPAAVEAEVAALLREPAR